MLVTWMLILSVLTALGVCALAGSFQSLEWLWVLPAGFVGSFLALFVLAFAFLYLLCCRVDTSVPQEHDDPFYRKVANVYIAAIVRLLGIRLETRGFEKLPSLGRFVLVCNHIFDLDPVVLYACFPNSQLAFISKRENTTMFIVGKLMHKLMAQLINRENDREALKTILKCIQLIKEDEVSIAVFPEGYTSKTRHLQHFRSGVFKIATKAQVPIVVCTVQGTNKVPGNLKRLHASPVQLHLLDVIPPERFQGRTTTDIAAEVYSLMAADLGPDYAPVDTDFNTDNP